MLVLTRKQSETIRIGENIYIKVIRTGRTTVKIGIEAPTNVRVVRGELKPKIEATVGAAIQSKTGTNALSVDSEPDDETENCSDQFPHPHLAQFALA